MTGKKTVSLPSEALTTINDPVALAIYTFYHSSPARPLRAAHIRQRFGLGRHRYDNAMHHLRERGYIQYANPKDDAGQMTSRDIEMRLTPEVSDEQ